MLHTKKKEEQKGQLHNSAQATTAPSGRFAQVSLPPLSTRAM